MQGYVTPQEYYLMHHGIAKMKWGHRNGPPYPLKRGQLSQAEKRSMVRDGDLKKIKKNIKQFTNKELQDAYDRYIQNETLNRKLQELEDADIDRKVAKAKKTLDNVSAISNSVVKITSAGIAIYNAGAVASNVFGGKNMKTIDMVGWFDGQNRQKGKGNDDKK